MDAATIAHGPTETEGAGYLSVDTSKHFHPMVVGLYAMG